MRLVKQLLCETHFSLFYYMAMRRYSNRIYNLALDNFCEQIVNINIKFSHVLFYFCGIFHVYLFVNFVNNAKFSSSRIKSISFCAILGDEYYRRLFYYASVDCGSAKFRPTF